MFSSFRARPQFDCDKFSRENVIHEFHRHVLEIFTVDVHTFFSFGHLEESRFCLFSPVSSMVSVRLSVVRKTQVT